jgi:hypothetical protein
MGSGETAPGMTKVHRELLSGLGEVRAVNLDTPYGFQLNVPQMTQKLVDYFKVSLQTDLKPLSFTNFEKSSGVERELFRQSVREANYVFAGPGSPSYALAQWKGLDLQEDLLHVLDNGGVVCFSSAAALTLGAFTAPIYEIYKAGAEPFWLEGLNLMGLLGINCAVIPHFNNAEGQDYDTSCCYLGLGRLELLEEKLPNEVSALGVDEHTAAIFDLTYNNFSVIGKGNAYWRNHGTTRSIELNSTIPVKALEPNNKIAPKYANAIHESMLTMEPLELAAIVEQGGNQAILALSKLVNFANDANIKANNYSSLIDALLETRRELKISGNFQVSDQIRNLLLEFKIIIKDTPNGTTWSFQN